MPFDQLRLRQPVTDERFDLLYPEAFRAVSFTHFTPVAEAVAAARFLAPERGVRVLDIGSGIGKFCMIGAAVTPGHFTGVELREAYHKQALKTLASHPSDRVDFVHADVESLSFDPFDAFYLFNPFFENVIEDEDINRWAIEKSKDRYFHYATIVNDRLERQPLGTRVATFYGFGPEIPESYKPVGEEVLPKLIFWEKVGYPA